MRRARTLLLAIVATLLLAAPAAAAKPVMEKIQINDIGVVDEFLTEACGFEVLVDVTGHVIFRTWLDTDGNPIREVNNFAIQARFYTEAASFSTVDVGADRVTHNPDGSILLTVIGNIQPIQLPGLGLVYVDVGRTVLHITFPDPEEPPVVEVLQQSGQHDEEFPSDIVCEFLAG
jgi:hypothetical protein